MSEGLPPDMDERRAAVGGEGPARPHRCAARRTAVAAAPAQITVS